MTRLPYPVRVMMVANLVGLILTLVGDAFGGAWRELFFTFLWSVYGAFTGWTMGREMGGRPIITPAVDPLTAAERARAALFRHLNLQQAHEYLDTGTVRETIEGLQYVIGPAGIVGPHGHSRCLQMRDRRGLPMPPADKILTLLLILRHNANGRKYCQGQSWISPLPWRF